MVGVATWATPAGSDYYLFQSPSNATDCLISAHGGYWRFTRTFAVPQGVTLHFYSQHGDALDDPGMALLRNNYAPAQTVNNGNCTNYVLKKFQVGPDNAGESYRTIETTINNEYQRYLRWVRRMDDAANANARENARQQADASRSKNVLTIRARKWPFDGGSLRDAVAAARAVKPSLTTFHCSFCRSLILC